jgi:hypothetical protein
MMKNGEKSKAIPKEKKNSFKQGEKQEISRNRDALATELTEKLYTLPIFR